MRVDVRAVALVSAFARHVRKGPNPAKNRIEHKMGVGPVTSRGVSHAGS